MAKYKWLLECIGPFMIGSLIGAIFLALTGCAQQPVIESNYCAIAHLIFIDAKNDKLTDQTAREILTNNQTYQSLCGSKINGRTK